MDDNAYILGYETGIEAGREEVVDWIKEEGEYPTKHYENEAFHHKPKECRLCMWQAKLKEWGISTPTHKGGTG